MSEEIPPKQLKITERDRREAQRNVIRELHHTSNPDKAEDLLNEVSLPTDVPEEQDSTKIDESEFPF